MAQKPEIQYVGRFYVHGSEARALEQQSQKKEKKELPQPKYARIRKVQVDVVAISSIVMSIVLMVTMVAGILSLETAWQELETARQYVYELEDVNRELVVRFRSKYNLEQVRSSALAMGLVPESEVQTMTIHVTVPETFPQMTWLEEMVWSVKHMFQA